VLRTSDVAGDPLVVLADIHHERLARRDELGRDLFGTRVLYNEQPRSVNPPVATPRHFEGVSGRNHWVLRLIAVRLRDAKLDKRVIRRSTLGKLSPVS
jgi:hypothetical protein